MVHKILPCIISQQSCEMSLYKLNQLGMLFCVIFNDIQTEKEKIDTKETDLKRLEEKKPLNVNISQADGRFMSFWVRLADVFHCMTLLLSS